MVNEGKTVKPESWTVTSPTTAAVWSNFQRIFKGDRLALGSNPIVRVVDARPVMSVDGMYEVEVEAL